MISFISCAILSDGQKNIPQLLEKNRPDAAFAIALELCCCQPLIMERDVMRVYLVRYKKRIRKQIMDGSRTLGETVTAWNNEDKRQLVCDFIKEQATCYAEFHGAEKVILALIPTTTLAGNPISITREMNDDELEEQSMKEWRDMEAEREKRIAEREAMSVIPSNEDFEKRIFTVLNIDPDCDSIPYIMHDEGGKILSLIDDEEYDFAALRFM